MFSYSKGQAVVVFLKFMLCLIVMNQVVSAVFVSVETVRILQEGERLSMGALMGVLTSPWIVAIGNTAAWFLFMFWEMKSARLPRRAALTMRLKPVWLFAPVFLVGCGMLLVINELDFRFAQLAPPPEVFMRLMGDLGNMTGQPAGAVLALVVVAPFTEEVLCRGILLRGMLNRLRPWTAIAMSALLFAMMHMNPWQAVSAFVIGLVLGWIYMRTRSVALCIFVHALNNAVALYFMSKINAGADEAELSWENTWWMNLGGMALLAAGAAWLWRATRAGTPADEYAVARPPPLPPLPPPLPGA
jgi:membrane protease YdiL (CAAX protease family)